MPAAIKTGNLTVRPHSIVVKVMYDEQKGRATGVEIIDTETKKTEQFFARVIFLECVNSGHCNNITEVNICPFPEWTG